MLVLVFLSSTRSIVNRQLTSSSCPLLTEIPSQLSSMFSSTLSNVVHRQPKLKFLELGHYKALTLHILLASNEAMKNTQQVHDFNSESAAGCIDNICDPGVNAVNTLIVKHCSLKQV